ncbi:uncharacterized protein Z520_07880 [Fonsecaea multimorphosa CBS 102226]|uniref:DUF4149 domain-containing protein n=1 Tax=Fonsecaea multimorphosa CBS 102226 TaxID=1442371 RepID=A0A0D2K0U4_9EURO|nr:uncharacterized protein Z520_07880 [Fonsecaea multimorphosa CBS 102226]KIX96614.1 hypothetical protein Z520_07880 [Fonsecaea multimorphosa CBS 102226]OAL22127.1 hypothetical protein AYO22_07487 [Fonsecaea multimorphosa]
MASLRTSALPALTGLMGTMGIVTGLYSFRAPVDAETLFGILVPSSVNASKELSTWQHAQTYTRGLRNFAGGLSIVGITVFWRFSSLCQSSPVAALTAKRCLGIIFLTGSVIGAGDGLIINQFARGEGISEKAREVAKKAGLGHLVMALPILALGLSCFFI